MSIRRLTAFAVLAVAGVGCGNQTPHQTRFSVRLLTSLPQSGRWETAAEQGLGRIAAELDAEVGRRRVTDESARRSALLAAGTAGFDLVFCVGGGFEGLLYDEVGRFPETVFIMIPGQAHAANLGAIQFLSEEAGYVAGSVAGAARPGAAIGILRGTGRPWLEQLEEGYVAGSLTRRGLREVVTAEGRDGVWELTAAGVEVALYSSDRTDNGVLAAAHDAGLYLIGTDPSVIDDDPVVVLGAVDVNVAEAMLRVAREVRDGQFVGRVFVFDLGSGALDVLVNEGLDEVTLTAVTDALEIARSEITAGFVEIEELGL